MRFLGLLAAAAVLATPVAVKAQTYNWSGFYVGLNAGYSWSDLKTTDSFLSTAGSVFGITPTVTRSYPAEDSKSKMDGWQLGGLAASGRLRADRDP